MEKRKLTELELSVIHHTHPTLNYAYQKAVSFSQYSIWANCPHQWYNKYVNKLDPYNDTIHTLFGTAMHETLQNYLTVMYENTGKYADENIDLENYFEETFRKVYHEMYEKTKTHVSDPVEMSEFFDDGIEILRYFKKHRSKYFQKQGMTLLGVEIPLMTNISGNFYLKGFIDIVLYDYETDTVFIYDIKTSGKGWGDKEKKDDVKISQVLLYKEYFAKQYNYDVDKIEVVYFILKRKIWENSDFPIPRISLFKPPSGKSKRTKAKANIEAFIEDAFDKNGKPLTDKKFLKKVSDTACKWCPFSNTEHCDKTN